MELASAAGRRPELERLISYGSSEKRPNVFETCLQHIHSYLLLSLSNGKKKKLIIPVLRHPLHGGDITGQIDARNELHTDEHGWRLL